jgi:hypothetical protein
MKNIFKSYLLVIPLFFILSNVDGQVNPFLKANNTLKDSGYVAALYGLIEDKSLYQNTYLSSAYYQALSTYYSFVGRQKEAINAFDKMYFNNPDTIKRKPQKIIDLPENVELLNAFDYISKITMGHQIIVINEAHYIPQHRIFTKELLPILKSQGYEYLCVEALSYNDTTFTNLNYPTSNSGFYTKEPAFGNLLRKAISLNYKVYPYDKSVNCRNTSDQKYYCNNLRELSQAIEIKKILDKTPSAKIIIHVGHAHLEESTDTDWVKMGEYLQILTGINPLTINQTDYRERSAILDNSLYETIVAKSDAVGPFICLVNDSIWYPNKDKRNRYDIPIIWNKTTYKNNRPSYLAVQSNIQEYIIPPQKTIKNTIIQAFLKTEIENEIAFDQIIVEDEKESVSLFLEIGNTYTIIIKDRMNKILFNYKISI